MQLHDLVGELSTRSDDFRTRWGSHDVRHHGTGTKRFHHPVVGELTLAYEGLELAAEPGLTLTIYTAEPGSASDEPTPAPRLLGRHPRRRQQRRQPSERRDTDDVPWRESSSPDRPPGSASPPPEAMLAAGHRVIVHARNDQRAGALGPLHEAGADVVIGDLARPRRDHPESPTPSTPSGRSTPSSTTPASTPTPNPTEPSTATPASSPSTCSPPTSSPRSINRPARLIYLSSGMHTSGRAALDDLDWHHRPWNGVQAYCDSKLLVTTLAAAVARYWPDVRSNTVDPGWVPTRMGGPDATDDLALGHDTQVWLATSAEPQPPSPASTGTTDASSRPHAAVHDRGFQDQLLATLAEITGSERLALA